MSNDPKITEPVACRWRYLYDIPSHWTHRGGVIESQKASSGYVGIESQPLYLEDAVKAAEDEGFDRGTIVAASILLNCWTDEVQAEEILRAAGITLERALSLDLCDYDSDVVIPLLRRMEQKDAA